MNFDNWILKKDKKKKLDIKKIVSQNLETDKDFFIDIKTNYYSKTFFIEEISVVNSPPGPVKAYQTDDCKNTTLWTDWLVVISWPVVGQIQIMKKVANYKF